MQMVLVDLKKAHFIVSSQFYRELEQNNGYARLVRIYTQNRKLCAEIKVDGFYFSNTIYAYMICNVNFGSKFDAQYHI